MATTTPNYGWTVPTSSDLVKDGATAIETLGDAIDASMNTALGTKKAGMVLLNTTSFSGVASQSFSNFTSASYSKYRIVGNATSTVDATGLIFRFRANVTDLATGYYGSGFASKFDNTSAMFTAENNGTSYKITNLDVALNSYFTFDFFKPSTTQVGIIGQAQEADGGRNIAFGCLTTTSTDATGFSLLTGSGNMTGKVSVYGYNE